MDTSIYGYTAAILTTAAYVPQVWHTWRSRNAEGLSLPMLLMFCTGIALWLVYGLLQSDIPMTLANTITLALSSSLLVMKIRSLRKPKT